MHSKPINNTLNNKKYWELNQLLCHIRTFNYFILSTLLSERRVSNGIRFFIENIRF